MKEFSWIFRHYFRRSVLEPVGTLILVGLPTLLIVVLSMVYANLSEVEYMWNGYNMISTNIAIPMMIMFQFFGGNLMLDWLYIDFRSSKRWRLLSAPIPQNTFVFGAGVACWLTSIAQGMLVVGVSTFFLDAYWGNFFVLFVVLITVSAIGQFMYMLLFLLTKNKGTAEGIAQVIIWGMTLASGWISGFYAGNVSSGENSLMDFITNYSTPVSLARRAITYSGFVGNDISVALQSLGLLVGVAVLSAGVVIIVGRRRSF